MSDFRGNVLVMCPSASATEALRCVQSLLADSSVFTEREVKMLVVDDSEEQGIRDAFAHIQRSSPTDVSVFDLESIELLKSSPIGTVVCDLLCEGILELLGSRQWSAARARNWCLLAALLQSSNGDLVLFIDGDVVMPPVAGERGKRSILERLVHCGSVPTVAAVGLMYEGQADLSLLEHQLTLLRNKNIDSVYPRTEEVTAVHSHLCVRDFDGSRGLVGAYGGPHGLSGGCVLVKRELCVSYYFPNFYNEDWIWLLLNEGPSRKYELLDVRVGHHPASDGRRRRDLLYEEMGEILFDALEPFGGQFVAGENNLELLEKVGLSELEAERGKRLVLYRAAIEESTRRVESAQGGERMLLNAVRSSLLEGEIALCRVDTRRILTEIRGYLSKTATWRDSADLIQSVDIEGLSRWIR